MKRTRTVVVAGTVSAVLVSASAVFALSSGLFSAGAAGQVGTFQTIEQRQSTATSTTSARHAGSTQASVAPTTARGESSPGGASEVTSTTPESVSTSQPEPTSEPTTVASRDGGGQDQASTTSAPTSSTEAGTTTTSRSTTTTEPGDGAGNGRGSDD